jgi:hypothetical protein
VLRRARPRQVARGLLVIVAGLIVVTSTSAASAANSRSVHTYRMKGTRPLRTALFDPYSFSGASLQAYALAHKAGAGYVRLMVNWDSIAPAERPAGFVAQDPTSHGYQWSWLDATVAAVKAAGLNPIIDLVKPPKWAYAVRPHKFSAGTPDVKELGLFAKAIATHYDGSGSAPHVSVFQVWNEPNNSLDLSPVNGNTYRRMVNAFAAGVHAADRGDVVVAGGLDPFKNQTRRFHTAAPLAFMRSVLCLSKGAHPHATCKTQVHFDVWSHHPYTFDGPFGHARLPDDVSLGDLPKMDATLRAGVRLHRIVSSHPVQFWVTEFSWDTNPPRPHAAPMRLQTRWTSESLYQMWRSGVSLVTWFLLQDRPSPSPYQSGLYFHSSSLDTARAKPTRQAFRFPFVAYLGKGTVRVWGRTATSTKQMVTIEMRQGVHGQWRTVARVGANGSGIFEATLRLRANAKDWLRAVAPGSGNSLAFSLTVPKNQRYGPWGT